MRTVRWEHMVYGKPVGPDGEVVLGAEHGVIARSAGIPPELEQHLRPRSLDLACAYWSEFPLLERGAVAIRWLEAGGREWVVVARASGKLEAHRGQLYTHCDFLAAVDPPPASLPAAAGRVSLSPVAKGEVSTGVVELPAGPGALPADARELLERMVGALAARGEHAAPIESADGEDAFFALAAAVVALVPAKYRRRLRIGWGAPPDSRPRATLHLDGAGPISFPELPRVSFQSVEQLEVELGRATRVPTAGAPWESRGAGARERTGRPVAASRPNVPAGAAPLHEAPAAPHRERTTGATPPPGSGCGLAVGLAIGLVLGMAAEARWHVAARTAAFGGDLLAAVLRN